MKALVILLALASTVNANETLTMVKVVDGKSAAVTGIFTDVGEKCAELTGTLDGFIACAKDNAEIVTKVEE